MSQREGEKSEQGEAPMGSFLKRRSKGGACAAQTAFVAQGREDSGSIDLPQTSAVEDGPTLARIRTETR